MNEGASLPAGAIDCHRIIDSSLHDKAIQDGSKVAVIIKPIDQPFVHRGFVGLRSPNNPLVQVCDFDFVVLIVECEQQLVLGFGQMIN